MRLLHGRNCCSLLPHEPGVAKLCLKQFECQHIQLQTSQFLCGQANFSACPVGVLRVAQ